LTNTPTTNAAGEIITTKSIETNKDLKIFDDSKVNLVKRYYTMFFPGTFDE